MILIITPVYRAYDKVKELCEAVDKLTVNPYLHILVDDDSNVDEPFPVKASANRRIILLQRDYSGMVHKNGGAQAIQIGYDWAHQLWIGEHPNILPYDNIFMIESDVIPLEQGWDQKMIDLIQTLPNDWGTLDCQSVDEAGNLTYPTTVSPRLGMERDDLEIMKYPDFQNTLFNQKLFDAGIKFSDAPSHFDINFGNKTTELLGVRHFRTMTVFVKHYFYQSRQYLNEVPRE
jgi:glycosyltransferase involved in cell wall biosynthesis